MDWSSIVIALAFTMVCYGLAPLLFLAIRVKPICKSQFRLFCIIYTVSVWLGFRIFYSFNGFDGYSTGGPAIILGTIFYNFVVSRLRKSGRINASTGTPAIPQNNHPENVESEAPISQTPDVEAGSSQPPKSFIKKYETFYTCPACGSLVPKGTCTCDCGFVFRKRHDWRKIGIRISVCLVIAAALIGCSYASFRYGQSTVSRDRETYAQQRVDSIIKEIFSGQTDPFSGNPVDSEASYRAYLKEFNAYKAAQ